MNTLRDTLATGGARSPSSSSRRRPRRVSGPCGRRSAVSRPLSPTFVSVTYGAGGSSRDRTIEVTKRIVGETTLRPVAHLTAVGHSVAELRHIIGQYADAGIRDVLALRGDPPGAPNGPWRPHPHGLRHAQELVTLVKESGDFSVGVAAFPERHPRFAGLGQRHPAFRRQVPGRRRLRPHPDVLPTWRTICGCGTGSPRPAARPRSFPEIMPATDVRQIRRFAELSHAAFPEDLAHRLEAAARRPRGSPSHRRRPRHRDGRAAARGRSPGPALHHPEPVHRDTGDPPEPRPVRRRRTAPTGPTPVGGRPMHPLVPAEAGT